MAKRMSKAELLEEIQGERAKLEATLAGLNKTQMTQPGVTEAGWAVRDVLAHLVDWEQRGLEWYAAGLRGEKPELPAPGMKWSELPRLNQQIFEKSRRRALQKVLDEFQASYQRVLSVVQAMPAEDLEVPGRFAWTGKWTVGQFMAANSGSHYRWARDLIRKWAKAQGATPAKKAVPPKKTTAGKKTAPQKATRAK